MKITLLSHERELLRPSNSGALVLATLPEIAERRVWQRKKADAEWLEMMAEGRSVLVYPVEQLTCPALHVGELDHFILIDATWQESRKIYNRSPYLQELPALHLDAPVASQYRLRRNQQPGALCTAEVVIQLLRQQGELQSAALMQQAFELFNE